MARTIKLVCLLTLPIMYNFSMSDGQTNNTQLILNFLCNLNFIVPYWISKRVRIVVSNDDFAFLQKDSHQKKKIVSNLYKLLGNKSYVALSSINNIEKTKEGDMELRIFPFISTNISSVCNIYLNHRHKTHYYYFSYVDHPEDLHKSMKNCPLTFDSNFYIFYPNF